MIITLLFVIGFLFNGEQFAFYIDNFQESFYRSTFVFDDIGDEMQLNELIEDFNSAAKENEVDFFMIDSRIESAYRKVITIYGTEDAFKYIESKGIHNKEYLSILMGTIDVNFVPFDEIKNMEIFDYCYYVGDATSLDDMRAFKSSLIDKYGGGFPKLFGSDRETKLNMISVWSIIIFVMSLLLIYEILLQKKEIALKVVFGEDIKTIFLKNILSDCSFIISTFAILLLFLSRFSNVSFMMNLVMKLIGISLIIDLIINLTVFRINFKKHFARGMTSGKLLIINYAIKSLITGLVILMLSSNIVLILYGINHFKQQDYFKAVNQSSPY